MEALQREAGSDTPGPAVDQQEVVEKPRSLHFRFVRLSRFDPENLDGAGDPLPPSTPAETLYVVLDGKDAAAVTFSHEWDEWSEGPEPGFHPAFGGLPHYHVQIFGDPGGGEVAAVSHHARREGDEGVEADPAAITEWIGGRLGLTWHEREALRQVIVSSSLPW